MRILIDTNVAITYVMNRETDPDKDAVFDVFGRCINEEVEGFFAFHSVSNMWYLLKKSYTEDGTACLLTKKDVRNYIRDVCVILTVIGADTDSVLEAIDNESFSDFEDCLQEACASDAKLDYIVTSNTKDFKASRIPAITPRQFISLLDENADNNEESE